MPHTRTTLEEFKHCRKAVIFYLDVVDKNKLDKHLFLVLEAQSSGSTKTTPFSYTITTQLRILTGHFIHA